MAFETKVTQSLEPTILAGVNLLSALKKKKILLANCFTEAVLSYIHFAYWLLSTYESGIFLIAIKNCTLSVACTVLVPKNYKEQTVMILR